jgi:Fe-S-cluster-containing dehydrogenase component/formate-dependent nitrite reductase membrane component NrfD
MSRLRWIGPLKYGFVIDQRKCIGCHACTVACKMENDVPLGAFRTWVKYIEKGEFPNTRRYFAVLRCNHCDNAPCVTICPTVALFKRDDGIVDFDSSRCIGCKSCMQACPYDALYIDPESHTAAKCHYCAHRTEIGLQPACVLVCPEQAIIAGDLDNPTTEIARLVSREQVSVRKPEQGTQPKLYYVGADDVALTPAVAERSNGYMWSERPNDFDSSLSLSRPLISVEPSAPVTKDSSPDLVIEPRDLEEGKSRIARLREVYDVYHAQPWGWRVSTYLWTKSVGSGALLVAAIASLMGPPTGNLLNVAAPLLALVFTAITTGLLVSDLKRPERFLYVLFKPNLQSWLVIGAWALIAYGVLAGFWLFAGLSNVGWVGFLRWPVAIAALAAAGYSAFLFGQAEGRDFWQSPLLLPQLIAAAVVAGSATLLAIATFLPTQAAVVPNPFAIVLAVGLVVSALILFAELYTPHANSDVVRSARLLTDGALSPVFWGGVVFIGMVVPLGLLFISRAAAGPFACLAAIFALIGLLLYEDLWVQAGQSVPLS